MTIGSVVKKGSTIHVYNEKGGLLFAKAVGMDPKKDVVGYTANTVSIRMGSSIITYNEKGHQKSATSAK